MSVWTRADRLPNVIEQAPSTARMVVISRPGLSSTANRHRTTMAPILGMVATNAAVSLLAP